MIGLRRKNILIYLNPDDHMMDMWQKDYVLQLDNWRKQWSGCSRTWQITVRSSSSGHRLRTPDRLRTPEEEYSDIPKSGRQHDGYMVEGLCSPIRQLDQAVFRLQQGIADYLAELKLNRTQTPAVSTRYWDSVQTTVEAPAPTPEVPAVEMSLHRLVTDTQSRPLPVVNPPAPTELEQSMCPCLAEQRRRWRRRPGGPPFGSGIMFGPGTQEGEQCRLFPHNR